MGNIFVPGADVDAFLRRGLENGFSMQEKLFEPSVGQAISSELIMNGLHEDLIELKPTHQLADKDMTMAAMLHVGLNKAICRITGKDKNHLPLFSVRIFEPGMHSTTIHRNDESVGPWTLGMTLLGKAPFNTYAQNQLDRYTTRPLKGDGTDPTPVASMNACAGSGWSLYTQRVQTPHAGGFVESDEPRELIIFYNRFN